MSTPVRLTSGSMSMYRLVLFVGFWEAQIRLRKLKRAHGGGRAGGGAGGVGDVCVEKRAGGSAAPVGGVGQC